MQYSSDLIHTYAGVYITMFLLTPIVRNIIMLSGNFMYLPTDNEEGPEYATTKDKRKQNISDSL